MELFSIRIQRTFQLVSTGKKQMFHIKDKRWTRKTVKQANAQNGRLKKS